MKKKLLILFLIIFILNNINSLTVNLKKEIYTDKNQIYLNEIILNEIELPEIIIKNITNFPDKIYALDILTKLYENNIYDAHILGEYVIILKDNSNNNFNYINPIIDLENYIKSFLIDTCEIKINLIDITPKIDLYLINDNFKWKIKKFNDILKEIKNNMTIPIVINEKEYAAKVEISIYSDIFISNNNFKKGDIINPNNFKCINADIFDFNDFESIVFNLDDAKNSIFINDLNSNEILRWEYLKKIPVVKKSEKLNLIVKRDILDLIIPCISLMDGFENEKIKVKLNNGNEIYGIIKKTGDNKYAIYN